MGGDCFSDILVSFSYLFPRFDCFCLLSTPTPQFSLKTFKTESLKTDSLKLLSVVSSGNLFNTSFEFRGHIPVALNPAIKFDGFSLCINFRSIEGNASFGRLSFLLDSRLQVSKMSFHSIFAERKTATSRGWHK